MMCSLPPQSIIILAVELPPLYQRGEQLLQVQEDFEIDKSREDDASHENVQVDTHIDRVRAIRDTDIFCFSCRSLIVWLRRSTNSIFVSSPFSARMLSIEGSKLIKISYAAHRTPAHNTGEKAASEENNWGVQNL